MTPHILNDSMDVDEHDEDNITIEIQCEGPSGDAENQATEVTGTSATANVDGLPGPIDAVHNFFSTDDWDDSGFPRLQNWELLGVGLSYLTSPGSSPPSTPPIGSSNTTPESGDFYLGYEFEDHDRSAVSDSEYYLNNTEYQDIQGRCYALEGALPGLLTAAPFGYEFRKDGSAHRFSALEEDPPSVLWSGSVPPSRTVLSPFASPGTLSEPLPEIDAERLLPAKKNRGNRRRKSTIQQSTRNSAKSQKRAGKKKMESPRGSPSFVRNMKLPERYHTSPGSDQRFEDGSRKPGHRYTRSATIPSRRDSNISGSPDPRAASPSLVQRRVSDIRHRSRSISPITPPVDLPYTRRERPSSRSRGTTLPDVSSILNPSSSHLASPSRTSFTHSPVQTHFPLRNASFDEQTSRRRNLRTSVMSVISVSFKDSAMRTGAGESSGETEDSTSDHSEISPRVGTHIRPAPARVYSDPAVGRYDTRRHSYPSPIDSLLPSDPISRRTSPRRGSLLGQSRQEDYQTREESLQLQSQAPFLAPIAGPSDLTLPPLDFGNISKTRNAAAFSAPVPVIGSRGPNTYEPVVDQADDEYDDDVSDDDGDDEYTPSVSHRRHSAVGPSRAPPPRNISPAHRKSRQSVSGSPGPRQYPSSGNGVSSVSASSSLPQEDAAASASSSRGGVSPNRSPNASYRSVGTKNIDLASEKRRKGEQKYKCSFEGCGKMFTTNQNRQIHEMKHTNNKPFQCGCGYGSASRSDLRRHLQRKNVTDKCQELPVDQGSLYQFTANVED